MIKMEKVLKKAVSMIVMISIMVSVVCGDIGYAKEGNGKREEKEEVVKKEVGEIVKERGIVAREYGKVTRVVDKGKGGEVVVEIQDLHSHEGVQRNIEKIIEELSEKYNVKGILVEGGYGEVGLEWLRGIKNKGYREKMVEELVREGKLSGGEYYGVKKRKEVKIYGLEEEGKHKENIKRLGYILENEGRYEEVLKKVGRQIKYLVDKNENRESRRFNEEVKRYRENKIKAERFYGILEKRIGIINSREGYNNILEIKEGEYENIRKYKELLEKEKRIKEKEVSIELEVLLKEIKGKMPYYEYKKMMENTENGKEILTLCKYLRQISEKYGIEMAKGYENLEKFMTVNELGSRINPIEMVKEERVLIEKIRGAYEKGAMEKEIGFIEDFYGYLKEYIGNKLMAMDCGYYVDNVEKFKRLYSKYAVVNELAGLEKDFEVLDAYYKLNNERNEIFVKKIKRAIGGEGEGQEGEGKELEGVKEEGKVGRGEIKEGNRIDQKEVEECLGRAKGIVIVVTGGYHSEGMGKILEREGISNIVITPSVVGDIGRAEKIYEGIIRDEVKILKEGLSYTLMSQMPEMERLRYFVNAGLEIIKGTGYSRELIKQMVIAINEAFGEGTVEVERLDEDEAMVRFWNREWIRIEKKEEGEIEIKVEGRIVEIEEAREEEENEVKKEEERGLGIERFIREEVLSGKIIDVKEQVKRFYRFAYEKGINGVLSTDGLIYELDEYRRREGVREIEGVDIEVISKMPKEVQEYLFAQVLGRSVDISRLGEKTRAVITAIVEIGHIFRASEEEGYFEEFLSMHGKENEVRREGLEAITRAVNAALNQTGVNIADRFQKAVAIAFNKHVEHNIAHPEAKLFLNFGRETVVIVAGLLLLVLIFYFFKKRSSYTALSSAAQSRMVTMPYSGLKNEYKRLLDSSPSIKSDDKVVVAYMKDLNDTEYEMAIKVSTQVTTQESWYIDSFFRIKKGYIDKDTTFLKKVLTDDKTYNIVHKLYAFMYLRILGAGISENEVNTLISDFFLEIQNEQFIAKFKEIKNSIAINFYLKALITGIDLILTSILSKTIQGLSYDQTKMVQLYTKRIPNALFLATDGINQGWSNLTFAKKLLRSFNTLCECIAHELGHNYLECLGFEMEDTFTNTTFHEFFAFAMQGLFSDTITHGWVTRSVRKVFSILSFNPFSIVRFPLSVFTRFDFVKGIYNQLVRIESGLAPSVSIFTISIIPGILITTITGLNYLHCFIQIEYIMRRVIPAISFGMDTLAHIDALSLLHTIDIADYKGLNFLVTIKLALKFLRQVDQVGQVRYDAQDPEYRMVDKFIGFTLKNLESIRSDFNTILENDKLTKEDILILITLGLVNKANVMKNITKYYNGGLRLTNPDILKALKEKGVLTEEDFRVLAKTRIGKKHLLSKKEFNLLFPHSKLQLPYLREIYKDYNISREVQAMMTGLLELGDIMRASVDRAYFEEFLKMHGEENEIRRAGLLAITRAVNAALNQTGVSISERISNAMEKAIGLHILWNMGYVEEVIGFEEESREADSMAMLEYHEVRKGELEGEIREFGGEVRVGVNGDISMGVYIISEKPEEGEEYKFENSGVSIGGSTLWIGEYKGAMAIYVEGGEIGEIGEEIRRNKKIKEKIRERIEASIKGKKVKEIEIEGIEVGRRGEEEEEGIRYSERGEIRVGYSEYREKVERGEELEFSTSLRAIKRAEGYAYARSIIHNLNDVEDVEGFKEYLKQHKKMGNGQIVVKESLVKKMIVEIREGRVMEFLNEGRKEGVEVYVMLEGEERVIGVKEYERMGFAGYVEGREISNFALGSKVEVGEIGSFRDEGELEERLREAKGMVLIENTELKKVIEESRTGLSIGELIGVLSNIKKAISIFRNRGISKEHVERVVRNIEIKDMPEVEEEMMGKIKEMVRDKDKMKIENLREALKIGEEGSDVISVYIGKVEREIEGREDREEIMEGLVRGIVERILVAEALRRKGKELGLRDKNHEIMLGKALMAGVEMGIEYDKGEKGGIEEFVRGLKTEIEVEVKLNKELAELMERGIEGKEEGAVRKIIELIPEISEGRRKIEIREDMRPKMDIRSYSSILSAA